MIDVKTEVGGIILHLLWLVYSPNRPRYPEPIFLVFPNSSAIARFVTWVAPDLGCQVVGRIVEIERLGSFRVELTSQCIRLLDLNQTSINENNTS